MGLEIVPRIPIDKNACERVGEFLYNREENSIYFELPYPFPVQLKITGWHLVEATPWFERLWTILKSNINLDILCRELDLLKYLANDELMLHASCYEEDCRGYLVMGFPNTGKTYQTYKAKARGAFLISEEYTIISKNGIARPYKETVRSCLSRRTIEDCGIYLTPTDRVKLFVNTLRARLFPFMFEAVIWKTYPVSRIITEVSVVRAGDKPLGGNTYKKLVLLTENEFPFMSEYILQAYAYISGFDLIGLQEKQRALLKRFADYVDAKRI